MTNYNIFKTPLTVMTELAKKVQLLRKKNKISQLELANRSGVSFGSIKRFETTGQISLESLLKIAYFFNRLNDFSAVFLIENDKEEVAKLFNDKPQQP